MQVLGSYLFLYVNKLTVNGFEQAKGTMSRSRRHNQFNDKNI